MSLLLLLVLTIPSILGVAHLLEQRYPISTKTIDEDNLWATRQVRLLRDALKRMWLAAHQ